MTHSSRRLPQVLAAPVVAASLFLLPASVAQTNQNNGQWLPVGGSSFVGGLLGGVSILGVLLNLALKVNEKMIKMQTDLDNLNEKNKESDENMKTYVSSQIKDNFDPLNTKIDKRFDVISQNLDNRTGELKKETGTIIQRISELSTKIK